MKKVTKKITKKPKFIVDLTKVETAEDVKFEFIKTKALNGIKITEDDFRFIVQYGAELAFNTIDVCLDAFVNSNRYHQIKDDKLVNDIIELIENSSRPKKPWYKRFWGWITKPFKKKK